MVFMDLLKRYYVPLMFLSMAISLQLVILPSLSPPSHYDVLGVKRFASVEEIKEAYDKLSSKWDSGFEVPTTINYIKIRYAFELLSNPLWKRDYDRFSIDEHRDIIDKAKEQYKLKDISDIHLPLIDASINGDRAFNSFTPQEFTSGLENTNPRIILVYSSGSKRCIDFSNNWKIIGHLLDGVAAVGVVELGESDLSYFLAERRSLGQPFFSNGLPSIVALPSGCVSRACILRYQGSLTVDAVVDWTATMVLGLPQILYYSKESLGRNFIAKTGHHKVKVICFSKTGERAAPFLRKTSRDFQDYSSYALVLWREDDSSLWWNTFEVESAPAIVFVKEMGVKPIVYHGTFNWSSFLGIMEQNKHHDLPQLRSVTSMQLGCDARGYSRAGNDTRSWYCVILAGRLSIELNQMRETMRRVQSVLTEEHSLNDSVRLASLPASNAFKEKRLTFTWLDGEVQKKYCFFYLHSENSYETCGPRSYGDLSDVPRLFIVRYERNFTSHASETPSKPKSIWDALQQEDVANLASQLVARYNGSEEIQEIIQWISQIVDDGDSKNLPFFRTTTPELVPEDEASNWGKISQGFVPSKKGINHIFQSIVAYCYDRATDPWLPTVFLLAACISFGTLLFYREVKQNNGAQR